MPTLARRVVEVGLADREAWVGSGRAVQGRWEWRPLGEGRAGGAGTCEDFLADQTIDHLVLISTCSVLTRERAQMSKVSQQNSTPGVNGISVIHTQAHASGLQQVPQLGPAGPGGGGKAVPPSKQSKKSLPVDCNSDDCRQRRKRNNMAVKKSRLKSKQKAQDTRQRVNQLQEENELLEAKIKLLTKELSVLIYFLGMPTTSQITCNPVALKI